MTAARITKFTQGFVALAKQEAKKDIVTELLSYVEKNIQLVQSESDLVKCLEKFGFEIRKDGCIVEGLQLKHLSSLCESLEELTGVTSKRANSTRICLNTKTIPESLGSALGGIMPSDSKHTLAGLLIDAPSLDFTRTNFIERITRALVHRLELPSNKKDKQIYSLLTSLRKLISEADWAARAELFRLLLEGRYPMPLLVTRRENDRMCSENYVSVARLGEVLVREKSVMPVLQDTSLPWVVFASSFGPRSQMPYLVSSVFHVRTLAAMDAKFGVLGTMPLHVEAGVGFLVEDKPAKPIVLLHVLGIKALETAAQLAGCGATAIVVEADQSDEMLDNLRKALPESCVLLTWDPKGDGRSLSQTIVDECLDEEAECAEVNDEEQLPESNNQDHFFGSADSVQNSLPGRLRNLLASADSQGALARLELWADQQAPTTTPTLPSFICAYQGNKPFGLLQRLYAKLEQGRAPALQNARLQINETRADRSNREQKRKRLLGKMNAAAGHVLEEAPVLKDLLKTLELENQTERQLAVAELERTLAKKSLGMEIGIHNLWRELIQLRCFVSEQEAANLARLAARHLMDGFSLELVNGDANSIDAQWIDAVMQELQKLTGLSARVFVLSVAGVQSSGKSTLLNLMFGCRFRTSVGRCTRGSFLQLVRTEGVEEYNYVLVIDCEGVDSPELGETGESAAARDNWLVASSFLLADATIFLAFGEHHKVIERILPTVWAVYLRSDMLSEEFTNIVSFVFTRVSAKDVGSLDLIKNNLSASLTESFQAAMKLAGGDDKQQSTQLKEASERILEQLNAHETDPDRACMHLLAFFRNDKLDGTDQPEATYAEAAERLRRSIHLRYVERLRRQAARPCRSFLEISTMVEGVLKCLRADGFALEFRSVLDNLYYNQLFSKIRELVLEMRQKLQKEYNKRETHAKKIHLALNNWSREKNGKRAKRLLALAGGSLSDVPTDDEKRQVCKQLTSEYEQAVCQALAAAKQEALVQFKKLKENPEYKGRSWTISAEDMLNMDIRGLEKEAPRIIRQVIVGFFEKDSRKSEVVASLTKAVRECAAKYTDKTLSSNEAEQIFNNLFEKELQLLQNKFPPCPVALEVERAFRVLIAQTNSAELENSGYIQKFKRFIYKMQDGINNQDFEKENSLLRIKIDNCLMGIEAFNHQHLASIVSATEKHVGRITSQTIRGHLVCNAFHLTKDLMVSAHEKWSEQNYIPLLIKSQRSYFWENFQAVVQGITVGEQAIREILTMLNTKMPDLLKNYVTTEAVKQATRSLGIIDFSNISREMQNHLKKLIDECRRCRGSAESISKLTKFFRNTRNSIRKYVHAPLLEKAIEQVQATLRETFTSNFSRHLSQAFGDAQKNLDAACLKKALNDFFFLQLSEKNFLPDTGKLACDLSVFYFGNEEKVKGQALEVFNKWLQDCKPSREWAMEAVKVLESKDHNDMPCLEPCPWCCAPCYLPLREHHSNRGHQCIHQPKGVVGVHYRGTNKLTAISCVTSKRRGGSFIPDGHDTPIPYSDFHKHYPDWEPLPDDQGSEGYPGLLLEVMKEFNNELAQHYCREPADLSTL